MAFNGIGSSQSLLTNDAGGGGAVQGPLESPLPWEDSTSRFFYKIKIDPLRWAQLYPYRFIVVNTLEGNQVVNGTKDMQINIRKDNGRTAIEFSPLTSQWIYTLPITPQQLNIQDQFAINTTSTLLGVMEEHSGLRFKMINAAGSMGVWPFRESVTQPPSSPTFAQSIFGGTLEAASSALNSINATINTAVSGSPASKPVSILPQDSTFGSKSTGYYFAMSLQQFLEQYAEAKKDPVNKGWRLVFDIPKQNQSFVVTPMNFNWTQNANKPLEINYNLQLKAWRRINLNIPTPEPFDNVQKLSPGILQRVLNTISQARNTLSSATNLIGAVRSDVIAPLEALRQTSLFVKDLAGVVLTAADLPFQLQRDYKYAISDFFQSLSTSSILNQAATDPAVAQALKDFKVGWTRNENTSAASVRAGNLGPGAIQAQAIDPGLTLLESPEKQHALMNSVVLSQLSLNGAQQDAVQDAIDSAREITVDDLRSFRATIQQLALQLSNNFGAGDAYYSEIYGRPTPNARIQPMTLDEYQILKTLYDSMQVYDILTATTQIDDDKKQSNMDYVAGLADSAQILFNTTQAKILAPVPFGLTVEGIAQRYLGNAQRWLEIVTLNNLRDPYIDENGFQYPLLSNATGRQITVSTDENLFVGQRIVLRSSTQSESARRILNIDRLSDTSFLLTLDGVANLDNFTLADSAYLQAYLPGTVNSQQKIFIPSDLPVPNDPNILVPLSTQSDPLVGLSKVDWLLTDTGDIATNNYGDFRYAAGLTNLLQAIKIKMNTQKGKVLTHPDFGLGVRAGMMSSDVDVQNIYDSIDKLIKDDQRFQGLDNLQVNLVGPTLTINMGVILANNQGVFPVTFNLPM